MKLCWALAIAASAFAQSRVPFVGCPADGQVGPVDPPEEKAPAVMLTPAQAGQLAYYKADPTYGVLAPRGWHCFGTYGSGGDHLFITPDPIQKDAILAWDGLNGFGIELSHNFGDTSGRIRVGQIIARVFPEQRQFVEKMIEFDLASRDSFEFAPYRTDTLNYKSSKLVEYMTPARAQGLGTESTAFKAHDHAIRGLAALIGPAPDSLFLAIRLPANLESLASAIIADLEQRTLGIRGAK
jgi:hypothetical protein